LPASWFPRSTAPASWVSRVVDRAETAAVHVGVDLRRRQVGVPQHRLHHPEVCTALDEVGGEGVAKLVRAQWLAESPAWRVPPEELPHTLPGERGATRTDEERPRAAPAEQHRPTAAEPGPHLGHRPSPERDQPLLVALPSGDEIPGIELDRVD